MDYKGVKASAAPNRGCLCSCLFSKEAASEMSFLYLTPGPAGVAGSFSFQRRPAPCCSRPSEADCTTQGPGEQRGKHSHEEESNVTYSAKQIHSFIGFYLTSKPVPVDLLDAINNGCLLLTYRCRDEMTGGEETSLLLGVMTSGRFWIPVGVGEEGREGEGDTVIGEIPEDRRTGAGNETGKDVAVETGEDGDEKREEG